MGTTGMWVRKVDTASTSDPLVLVVVEGTERRTLVLEHYPFTIGRRTDRDLVMADPRVSREHAHFVRETDGIYIVDNGSRHGTFVNGERINRRKLMRNDQSRIWRARLGVCAVQPGPLPIQRGAAVPEPVLDLEAGQWRRL